MENDLHILYACIFFYVAVHKYSDGMKKKLLMIMWLHRMPKTRSNAMYLGPASNQPFQTQIFLFQFCGTMFNVYSKLGIPNLLSLNSDLTSLLAWGGRDWTINGNVEERE